MRTDPPLVSCIMPTRNRRHLVPQAIAYFLRQDYPRTELIVVDDGDDPVDDLMPGDARVRYLRLDQRTALGIKRNLAIQASRGELIAHWDDDDWMSADRLSVQVGLLSEAGAAITGARDLLYYHVGAGQAWQYRGSADPRPWPLGGTLLYRRAVWQARPFDALSVGEDAAFVASLPAAQIQATPDSSFYVGLLHADNAAPKHLDDPAWQRRPLDEVTQRIWSDRGFYARLRNGSTDEALPRLRSDPTPITLVADFDVATGYGSMAEYLALGLARAGANVRIAPLSSRRAGLSSEFRSLKEAAPGPDGPTLFFSWPRRNLEVGPDWFVNTMWESSALPTAWPAQLNRARAVIVPTRFVAQVCRSSGVHVPIHIIPEGVDPAVYSFVDRPVDRPMTTLIVGARDERKHVAEGIAAWRLAFADDPGARLIIKSSSAFAVDDARIHVVEGLEPTRGIAHWYARADVLLALGNEGFGLPLVEAMATGLPVIALDSEGQSDICADAAGRLLRVKPAAWEPFDSAVDGQCGVRGVPSVDAVAEQLRWVASHRSAARAMGRAAARWAIRERSVWRKGPAVLEVLERSTAAPRPLRRTYQLWVSSWRTACGVAEYTAHLAGAMPPSTGLQVAATGPELERTRVLHVQHQHGLYDEAALARATAHAAEKGVPVVVTEHLVRPDPPACERHADVLVSLSRAGVEVLRRRWPTKRVEHLPHGCPTWFPRRKTRRGRVIGAFGFAGPHKGFTRLLDVLRGGDGVEMVLYSAARSAEEEAQWNALADGLPVRRHTRFLAAHEVARRLAAEADALVFWYDEIDSPTVSGAVRVGLASGVPVLTSRTSWFEDVREVTYQPANLAEGVRHLLDDTRLREDLVESATAYCHAHSWTRSAERHVALWRSLEN